MKKFINTSLSLLLLLLIGTMVSAQEAQTLVVPLSKPNEIGFLEVDIKNGSIIVIGTDRKDIGISYSSAEGFDEDEYWESDWATQLGKKIGEQVKIKLKDFGKSKGDDRGGLRKIQSNNFKLEITEQYNQINIENNRMGAEPMLIKIEVPKTMNIDVENYNGGNLYVANVTGEINLESYNGAIKAEDIGGIARASTYNGDITIKFKDMPNNGEMSFENYNGDISISVPPSYKSQFKVKTEMGEILSDLDLKVMTDKNKPTTKGDGEVYKVYVDSWTFMELNGGSSNNIKIKTRNGDVLLRSNQK